MAINNSKRGSNNHTIKSHGNKSVLLFPDQLITVSPPDRFDDRFEKRRPKKPPRNPNVLFASKCRDFEMGYGDRGRSFFPSEDFLDYLRERRRMEGDNMMMDGKGRNNNNSNKKGSLGKRPSAVSNAFRVSMVMSLTFLSKRGSFRCLYSRTYALYTMKLGSCSIVVTQK